MKRLIIGIFILSTFEVLAYATLPIIPPTPLEYNDGNEYLGGGYYQKNTGEAGSYHSFIRVFENRFTAYHVIDGHTMSYNFDFSFADAGFFTLNILFYNNTNDIRSYKGEGYCINNSCHYNLNFGDQGFIEETIIFDDENNSITKTGSTHLISLDEEGLPTTEIIAWQDTSIYVGSFAQPEDEKSSNI